jgi:hypothetical protein
MLQITLARSDMHRGWSASIVTGEHEVVWTSPECFDSADKAYYRAIGEYVLRTWDEEAAHPRDGSPAAAQAPVCHPASK